MNGDDTPLNEPVPRTPLSPPSGRTESPPKNEDETDLTTPPQRMTIGLFEQRIGDAFRLVITTDEKVELSLAKLHDDSNPGGTSHRGSGQHASGTKFTLVFTGPPDVRMPQGIYTLEHDELGDLAIFLVPGQPDIINSYFCAPFN